jgi:hypothetical protein
MQFMSLYKPGREIYGPPNEQVMAALEKLIEQETTSGVLVATGGLLPSSTGARVQITDGKLTVIDGPFAETKELIGGYAILQVNSREEAVAAARRFLKVMGEGECEIRQMFDSDAEPCLEKAEEVRSSSAAAKR